MLSGPAATRVARPSNYALFRAYVRSILRLLTSSTRPLEPGIHPLRQYCWLFTSRIILPLCIQSINTIRFFLAPFQLRKKVTTQWSFKLRAPRTQLLPNTNLCCHAKSATQYRRSLRPHKPELEYTRRNRVKQVHTAAKGSGEDSGGDDKLTRSARSGIHNKFDLADILFCRIQEKDRQQSPSPSRYNTQGLWKTPSNWAACWCIGIPSSIWFLLQSSLYLLCRDYLVFGNQF